MTPACRLLLVEDNPADAALATAFLAEADVAFAITVARTLAEAIATLARARVDAVMLDLNLPDSCGVDTVTRLAAAAPDVPIVVVSGAAPPGLRESVVAAGAQDLLWKDAPESAMLARCILYAVERFRAESAHRRIGRLIDANPDALLVVDHEGVVRYVNSAAERLLARGREELVGEWLGFSASGDTAEIELVGGGRGGGPRSGEIRSAATPRTGEVRSAAIEWEGAPATLVSIRDVTETRLLAEQLREAQKLEAVALLAGGLAHDFNNLLVVIMGNVEFLASALPEGHRGLAMVARIEQAAARARQMTRQLLVFSRKTASRPVTFDAAAAVLQLSAMLRRSFPRSIALAAVPDAGVHKVRIDPTEFDQVLMNLAFNARQALPEGGRIAVGVAPMALCGPLAVLPAGDYVAIRVTDDGVGIPPENLGRVFEPFFTTKASGTGTGLGLAVCRSIARKAGGDVTVASAPGAGTTFTVLLPRSSDPLEVFAERPPPGAVRGAETILLAEDDMAVAAAVREALEESGFSVVLARDGEQARRLLESGACAPDLVLSDVVMPQLGGEGLADWLAAARPGLKVMLMTGHTDRAEALEAGASATRALIYKPFLPSELLAAVRGMLDGAG